MSLAISVALHCSILAVFLVSIDWKDPEQKIRPIEAMQVSFMPGEGEETAIPKLAAPKSVEKKVEEPVRELRQEVEDAVASETVKEASASEATASDGATENANPDLNAGSPDAGGFIWTPPAPDPNAADPSLNEPVMQRQRVVLPFVEMGKGASEAVLLSYDQGRFSDAASISEAVRLTRGGKITMVASVDEKGVVTKCVVMSTSGSALLDERACALVGSYEYKPAQDAKGKPHASIVTEVLEWAKDGEFAAPEETVRADAPATTTRIPTISFPDRGASKR